jgi:hypothetical protein
VIEKSNHPDLRAHDRRMLVRFEDAQGEGLFLVSWSMLTSFNQGLIRVPRKTLREANDLAYQLGLRVPGADRRAYIDRRSRKPITWFHSTSADALRAAERLVALLNRYGADLRRLETDQPPLILWEDDVQVVTRRPRRPSVSLMDQHQSRRRDRRKRLQRRRARAGRRLARAAKTAFP